MIIKVKDETFAGKVLHELELEMASCEVRVMDIITKRVEQEVARYNQSVGQHFNGLVNIKEKEILLHPNKSIQFRPGKESDKIDPEKQVYTALNAFLENEYFVLVDDQQVDHLQQVIHLQPNTQISFIKLTQLVGG
ncbi:MAG: hypothetical protein AAFP19_22225 [Bacteroidota bacterium]